MTRDIWGINPTKKFLFKYFDGSFILIISTMKKITLVITTLLLSFTMTFAQFGILDPSFGNSSVPGIDTFGNISVSGFLQAIAFQPDGKMLVSTGGGTLGLGRLNSDGSPDNNFGSSGWVTVGFFDMNDIFVLPNGQILTTGTPTNISYNDSYVWLYNSNGTLDNTFGSNGRVGDSTIGPGMARVALQGSSKIICSASQGLKRLNLADGTLDMTFGNNGFVRIPQLPLYPYTMAVDSTTGDILLAGLTAANHIAVARLTPAGALDATFASNGVDSLSITASGLSVTMKIREAAGKIILASDCDKPGHYNQVICLQFNSNGSLDNTFGTAGISYPHWKATGGNTEYFGGMDIQSDGRTMVACALLDSGVSASITSVALARLNTDGSSDSIYGVPKFDFNSNGAYAGALAVSPSGQPVVNGESGGFELIARYGIGYPAGINENAESVSMLALYPDPAHSSAILTFSIMENTEVSAMIYSTDGRVVKQIYNKEILQEGKYNKEIFLNDIAPGLYQVVFRDKNGIQHISFEKL